LCRRDAHGAKLLDATGVSLEIGRVHAMEAVMDAGNDRRRLAEFISRDPELYDVVSRHGLTEHDLLGAMRHLRQQGRPLADLWALVSFAARLKAVSLAAVGG
jgi:hypothetical protein